VARGATTSTSYIANTFERMPASLFPQIAPQFAAPHAIKVGGVASSQARAVPFDGTHAVTIEWSPVVGVSHYTVLAMQLTSAGTSSTLTAVAAFDTTTSAATMPPSLFAVGESYVFAVGTVVDPTTDYAGGVLRRQGFPVSFHEAVTARLLFAASCGNSVVDAPFEQCDSGGIATDRCNPDCTQPVCGDGFANAAAGETCDDAGDSIVCNADCTPAACGDGRVHPGGGEGCDDGNQRDGDGCSADCLIEPGFTCTGEPSICLRGPAITHARTRSAIDPAT
jgi:cysteine-rich repeat protein